jgi:hypothetical protein
VHCSVDARLGRCFEAAALTKGLDWVANPQHGCFHKRRALVSITLQLQKELLWLSSLTVVECVGLGVRHDVLRDVMKFLYSMYMHHSNEKWRKSTSMSTESFL